MCDVVESFTNALHEEGLDAEITHESSDEYTDTFYISKEIAGERVSYATTITYHHTTTGDHSTEKQLALEAREIAKSFEDYCTETFDWKDKHIEVKPYNDPEASCSRCGESVYFEQRSQAFHKNAELSNPQPIPIKQSTAIESFDDHERVLLKMYLIGKLQHVCKCDSLIH